MVPDDAPVGATAETGVELCAPFRGVVRALASVPDPVFADAMVGPGIAIEPVEDENGAEPWARPIAVLAPISGVVGTLLPHACAIELPSGASVLVHLGIDTVQLKGAGFSALVGVGAAVTAGQHIMTWVPQSAISDGHPLVSPIIAVQADPADLTQMVSAGDAIVAGQPLIRWN